MSVSGESFSGSLLPLIIVGDICTIDLLSFTMFCHSSTVAARAASLGLAVGHVEELSVLCVTRLSARVKLPWSDKVKLPWSSVTRVVVNPEIHTQIVSIKTHLRKIRTSSAYSPGAVNSSYSSPYSIE